MFFQIKLYYMFYKCEQDMFLCFWFFFTLYYMFYKNEQGVVSCYLLKITCMSSVAVVNIFIVNTCKSTNSLLRLNTSPNLIIFHVAREIMCTARGFLINISLYLCNFQHIFDHRRLVDNCLLNFQRQLFCPYSDRDKSKFNNI